MEKEARGWHEVVLVSGVGGVCVQRVMRLNITLACIKVVFVWTSERAERGGGWMETGVDVMSPLAAITQMYCRWSSDTRCSLRAHMHVFAYIHNMSMLVIIRVCLLSLLNLTGVCLTHRLQT